MKNYPLATKVLDHYHTWLKDISSGPYRPYLTVRSFNSAGTCSILWSRKTRRNHHLLSQGEVRAFLFIESLPQVIDIREQYALHPEYTLDIAEQLGIRHRGSRKLRSILPMTTDFLVQFRYGMETRWEAIAYKPRNIRQDTHPTPRIRSALNGLRIEETYWPQKGIPWNLRYEALYPRVVIYNIEFFRSHATLDATTQSQLGNFQAAFTENWTHHASTPLQQLIDDTGRDFRLGRADALNAFKYLAWRRQFPINLNQRVELYLPLPRARRPR